MNPAVPKILPEIVPVSSRNGIANARELGSEPLSRMQRFLPPTTMPASDWAMAPCSHVLPSSSLAARAFTPRAARSVTRTPTDPQAPVARFRNVRGLTNAVDETSPPHEKRSLRLATSDVRA